MEGKVRLKGIFTKWGENYEVEIWYSEVDKCWIVESDQIKFVVGVGDDIPMAMKDYEMAVDINFQTVVECGLPLPLGESKGWCENSDTVQRLREYVWNQKWYKDYIELQKAKNENGGR